MDTLIRTANTTMIHKDIFDDVDYLLLGEHLDIKKFHYLCLVTDLVVLTEKLMCFEGGHIYDDRGTSTFKDDISSENYLINSLYKRRIFIQRMDDEFRDFLFKGSFEEIGTELDTYAELYLASPPTHDDFYHLEQELMEMSFLQRKIIDFADEIGTPIYLPIYGPTQDWTSYEIFRTNKKNPSIELYKKLADFHHLKVEKLLKYVGTRQMYIPPLLSIILDRCSDRSNFIEQLIKLRDEFSDFRLLTTNAHKLILESEKLGDQIEILEDMENSWDILIKKIQKRNKKCLNHLWNVVKEVDPMKMTARGLDLLKNYDEERQIVDKFRPIFDAWNVSMNVRHYSRLIRKVFKEDIKR